MIDISDLWRNVFAGGDRPFLVERHRTVTYAQLRDRVDRALATIQRRDIQPGERMIVLLEDEADAAAAFASALFSGMVPVMLPHDIGQPRLDAICESIEPALLVRNADIFASGGVSSVRPRDVPASDLAYLLFTSGTTAAPSGVEITRGNLCSHLDTLLRLFGFSQATRIFNPTPVAHTDGLVFGPLLAMATGGAVIRPGPMRIGDLDSWIGLARVAGATHMMTNPTVLSLIERTTDRTDYFAFEGFQGILSGGSQLRRELWERFEARFHTQIWNVYGLTETVTTVLYSGRHPEMGPVGTLGRPIDCEARIAPPVGSPLGAAGQDVGELQVRGGHIFRGYWRNPERTAATFDGDWMRTGDLVRGLGDGSYDFLGRVKTAINSGGTLIRGEEIDECLLRHSSVVEAITVGLPDDEFEEIAVSVVVPKSSVDEAGLMLHCRRELEALKVPKRIVIVESIPRGDAGKPNLPAVRTMLTELLRTPSQPAVSTSDDLGKQVVELAALVFGVAPDTLSLSSSPDTVPGWDSFRHVNLILQVEDCFSVRIPGSVAGKVGSLGQLCEIIQGQRASALRNS